MARDLPDIPTAAAWLAQQEVEGQLLDHVRLVAGVAEHLAARLRHAGEDADPVLAHRGGLLHDMAKVSAKEAGRSHEVLAEEFLAELCQPAWERPAPRLRPEGKWDSVPRC